MLNSYDQMAEMYGEVMELNERLHKDIATKDKSLESITACLCKAGFEVRCRHLLHQHYITLRDIVHNYVLNW